MPGQVVAGINLFDTFTHAWDLAKATGQSTELDPEVAGAALEAAKMVVSEEVRGSAGFAQAVDAGAGAPTGDQLVAFLGRQP